MLTSASEKGDAIKPILARSSASIEDVKVEASDDAFEIFKRGEGLTDFRTVSWIQASVIFLKGMSPSPERP